MEKADENVEMAYKTTGDKKRFLSATKMIYKKIAVLREQLDLAKQQMEEKCNLKNKVDELFSVFQNENLVFDEFDEITVRRLVECIRVSKDRTITLILKGGMQTSKNIF